MKLLQILIAIDQLLNTILYAGWADETLSAAAFRKEQKGITSGKILRPIIDKIFFFDESHCFNAHLAEVKRKQYPSYYREE
jgi:hypothetical protein